MNTSIFIKRVGGSRQCIKIRFSRQLAWHDYHRNIWKSTRGLLARLFQKAKANKYIFSVTTGTSLYIILIGEVKVNQIGTMYVN